jgi:hypothetical protein
MEITAERPWIFCTGNFFGGAGSGGVICPAKIDFPGYVRYPIYTIRMFLVCVKL